MYYIWKSDSEYSKGNFFDNIIIKMFNIADMPTYIQGIPNQLDRDECSAFTFYGTESQVNVIKTDFWAKYLIFREIDEYSYFFKWKI